MTSKRLYYLLMAAIGVMLIGLIGGAYSINSHLSSQSTKLTSLKAKSQAQQQQQTSLTLAKKDIAKYADLEKIAQSVVPEDKNQAEAVREIVNIAAANSVTLSAISFPTSTLGATASGAPLPTPTSPAPVVTTPAATTKAPKSLSQLQAVKNIPGVYQLPITITSDPQSPVQYSKFISFLSDLEHNRRTAQVSSISITPDKTNRNYLDFNLILSEYIKP